MNINSKSIHSPTSENVTGNQPTDSRWMTEIIAGLTTFMTMAYIVVVNPAILTSTGMPKSDIFIATCIASATATLIMGVWARFPFALAPGMGLNAFFAYTVCNQYNVPWQSALGAVFLSGVVFLLLSVTGVRNRFLQAVPKDLSLSIAAGIGLFIAFIGLQHAGLVVKNDATMVSFGDLRSPSTLVSVVGLIITATLVCIKIPGAILIGIVSTGFLAMVTGTAPFPTELFSIPNFANGTVGAAIAAIPTLFTAELLLVVFTMLFVDMFDTMGTLLALGHTTGYIHKDGTLPRADRAFTADAVGTIVGALLGTSTVTTYIESSSGVVSGGKTGKTAVVVAILFLLTLPLFPLISSIPTIATAPALIIVGALMLNAVGRINWQDPVIGIPALLTVLSMPVTYNISTGLGIGFIFYCITHAASGRFKQLSIPVIAIALAFLIFFAFKIGG